VVATDVAWSAISAITQAALARDGTLAYLPGGETAARLKIVWVDRSGQPTPVTDATGVYADVRVSPDGTRLLLWNQAANDMLVVYDLAGGRSTRLPLRGNVSGGAWTPDGRRVIAALGATLVSVAADGSGDVETIATDASRFYPHIAPDGDTVAFEVGRRDNGSDIWTLSLKTHVTRPCVATRFNERVPRYSPDGRWLAYESDESGVVEIYVRPANCGGAKTQISTGGGHGAVWSSNSRELFFVSSNSVSVVNVNAAAGLIAGEPHCLFSWQSRYIVFDVMPDSRRFVMFEEQPAPVPSQINLVLGGLSGAGRR
jgi:eukaryotic-like serine/threonine-protein kinase